jgi:hypothetical protein
MRVIGNTLSARLMLLALHENEVACEWLAGPTVPPPSALALLPGPTLSLAQHSCKLWQQQAEKFQLPLLVPCAFYDLATTPGRCLKLKEEALLDALAGSAAHYTETPPYGVHPRLVLGARHQDVLPQLATELADVLDATLQSLGLYPQPLPESLSADWFQATPTVLTDMQLAAQHFPQLALQPTRQHQLTWALPQPLPAPVAPLLLLHRMPKGHTWLRLTATCFTLHYDGIADPRQHTLSPELDGPTVAALVQHATQLLPLLAKVAPQGPSVRVWGAHSTPDGLPLLGGLAPESPLWLLGGLGANDDLYAPALVEKLLELWRVEDYIESPLKPSRFAGYGAATTRHVPESLVFAEPVALPPRPAPEVHRQATQIAPEAEVKRATEVRMVGKEITSGAGATLRGRNEKPKLQTASIKT